MATVAEAFRAARDARRPIVMPYWLIDRARHRELPAVATALVRAGATAIELGLPFSDPIADGPVLEAAAGRAREHGTRFADLLDAARTVRSVLPVALLTYANPLWVRGLARSFRELRAAGVSAVIVADLSLEESRTWRRAADHQGLDLVLLAAPQRGTERIRRIARATRGFLYLVSRYGTTGASARGAEVDLRRLVRAARAAAATIPIAVGFGVRDAASSRRAIATGADGVIVGTILEEIAERHPHPAAAMGATLREIAVAADRALAERDGRRARPSRFRTR